MGGRNYFFLIKNYCAAYSRCFVFSSLRKISNFASPRWENFNSRAITKIPSSRGEETRSIQGRRVWNIRARIRIKTIERRRKCRNRPFIPDQSAILIRRLLLKPIRAPFFSLFPFFTRHSFHRSLAFLPFLLPPFPLLSFSPVLFFSFVPRSPHPLEPGRSHLLSFLRTEIFMVCPISDVANRH